MSLIEAALQPWSAFEPPSRTGYRRECGRVNPSVLLSADQRLGRGLGYGEDLVFLDAALERFGLALDPIALTPNAVLSLGLLNSILPDAAGDFVSVLIGLCGFPTCFLCGLP